MKLFGTLILVMALTLAGMNAEAARRMGGGKSVGQQSGNVTQRQAAPAAPAQGVTNAAAKPAVAPAVAPKKPWGAMLGGLAAGLGLAWLAHSLGVGEAVGQFMLIALLVLVAMVAIGWFMRRRKAAETPTASPYAFQGAAAGGMSSSQAPSYRPENVGNDASARPFERNSMFLDASHAAPSSGTMIGSGLSGSQAWGIPDGFDVPGFVQAAKANFVALQAAWDKSDVPALRSMMTDDMLIEIKAQLAERETHPGGGEPNSTDVVMIEAQLLGIEDLGEDYMASVEFSGMIREQPSAGPSPFREVWNMTKPKNGSRGWLVAGVQALQ
jgi:predicted lipid-binding transport protein (Tim44 family)